MSGLVAVAVREIRQRRAVLVAALVAGLLALAVPAFSALGRRDAREARELAALVFAAAFACAVAVVTGGGTITRELAERRHGFLFARPLSASAIWGGKTLAAWLLAVGSGVVVLVPAAVASRGVHLLGAVSPWGDAAATLAVGAAVTLALVAFSHALALMVRSRVPWLLALDAVAAVVIVGAVAWTARALYHARAEGALGVVLVAFAALAAAAALAGGLAQVSLGRTDPVRSHRALSSVLWGTLACGALLVAGYSRWVLGAGPGDLVRVGFVQAAPRGAWVALLGGRAAARGDYRPAFLYDTESGRSVRLDTSERYGNLATFSADGRLAAWLAPTGYADTSPLQITTLDLIDPTARPAATALVLSPPAHYELALSDDGRRVAVLGRELLQVYELASGRLLASPRLPPGAGTRLWFVAGGEAVRIETRALARVAGSEAWKAPAEVVIRELDLRTRALAETGRIGSVTPLAFWTMRHDLQGDRLVVTTSDAGVDITTLRDGRTGTVLAELARTGAGQPRALFLCDGSIALATSAPAGAQLRLFTAAGTPGTAVELGPSGRISVVGEAAPGRVVVTAWPTADAAAGQATALLVDPATAAVVRLAPGHSPLRSLPWSSGRVETGSVAARLFTTSDGGLALLDPGTGRFRTLLAGRGGVD